MNLRLFKTRMISVILLITLAASALFPQALAADEEVTEESTYVLNRNGNGEYTYLYQSPCLPSYQFADGTSSYTQVWVFTMYNALTGEHFPTYCVDINVTAVAGSDYRRLNLSDSSYSANSAGMVRAILQEGFYIIPIEGETVEDHAARVSAKTAELAAAAGVEGLTTGEAIAATQTAIWRVVHGPELSFPNFCQYIANRLSNTKYASLCSLAEVKAKGKEATHATVEKVYNYLISLDPVEATEKTVSPTSFIDLNDPVYTENADGSYTVTVTTTVDVQLTEGDTLTLEAKLGDAYTASTSLADGTQTVTLTLNNVPASLISEEVTLSISGYQTAKGYFLFDAIGDRNQSQTMTGYNNSRLPVYASVVASDERILNVNKTANVAAGNGSYKVKPLGGISFDIFQVATMDEYLSGSVTLPDAAEYQHPNLADYTVVTDEDGKVSFNFLHHGLPDGVYLIVEHPHPDVVAPIEPFYLYVPATDPTTGEEVYEITIRPKNDLKGGVNIEKDVISVGNDEASVNAYEKHSWLIGSTVPQDIATGQSYVISDTLDNRLDFLGNVVMVLENKGETALPLAVDTDYILTVTDVDSLSEGKPADSFKIELTPNGMSKLAATIGDANYNDYMLRVYFDAQINANAEMGKEIPNQAELSYVNENDFEFTVESDKPYVYTGGINLLKVDSQNSNVTLSGAVFEVYRDATQDEVAANSPALTQISGVAGKVVKVYFHGNAELTGDKVTSVTSDENGKVAIYGLAYGKYYLVESKAPAGYNLLGSPVELSVDNASHTAQKVVTVENVSGVELPDTGGCGTTLYTVSGVTLLGIALLLICFKKHIRANG